jgi:hypothetical protein
MCYRWKKDMTTFVSTRRGCVQIGEVVTTFIVSLRKMYF